MSTVAGTLPVSTGSIGKKIADRDTVILRARSTGGVTCHQVAEIFGASEFFQLEVIPEPSNTDGSTPSDSWVGVFDGLSLLGRSARIATGDTSTPASGCSVRV